MTQPDDLRERIARATYHVLVDWLTKQANPTMNMPTCRTVADAVIRELGLREEWLVDDIEPYDTREQAAERKAELIGGYGDDPPAEGVPVRFRYVTDWKADDLLPPCDPKCGPQTHVAGCSQRRYETDEGNHQ